MTLLTDIMSLLPICSDGTEGSCHLGIRLSFQIVWDPLVLV